MGRKVDNQAWQIQLSLRKCDLKCILIKTGRLAELKQLQLQSKVTTQMCPLFNVHCLDNVTVHRRDRRCMCIYIYISHSRDVRQCLRQKKKKKASATLPKKMNSKGFSLFLILQVSQPFM